MRDFQVQKLLQYPWLAAEEQEALAQQIQEEQPEWQPLLEAIEELTPVLRPLHPDPGESRFEELLAYYLVTRRFSGTLPLEVQAYFSALETELRANVALQQRLEVLADRLQALIGSFDAVQHFGSLTGYQIEAEALEEVRCSEPLGARSGRVAKHWGDRSARALGRQGRRWRWVERGALVVVGFAALYSALFVWGRHQQSELERLGFIAPVLLEVDTYRGEPLESAGPEAAYRQAVAQLRQAYTSVLGLFPHYRKAPLQEAAALLLHVVSQPEASPLLRHEAAFLLGKVQLLLEDVPAARQAFLQAVELEGPHAAEAQRLLEALAALERRS
ncbi:hypothetical protein [Rhodothermus bifroesti]|uniref:hypothetical protein n=1 Tax=Rhodothermus bifroesti TaxID=2823335 RepID=UPI000CB720D3|nr:hypothetical protein [Rhodothermus bifroesti]GBD02519.1 hypothetical protein HRbin18_02265 [bacterium HR18]